MDLPCGQSNFRQIVVAQITRVFHLPEPLYQTAVQQPNILPGLLMTIPPVENSVNYFSFPPEDSQNGPNLLKMVTCRALQLANNQTYYIIGDFQGTDRILNSNFETNPLDAMLVSFRNPLFQSVEGINFQPEIQFVENIVLPEMHYP